MFISLCIVFLVLEPSTEPEVVKSFHSVASQPMCASREILKYSHKSYMTGRLKVWYTEILDKLTPPLAVNSLRILLLSIKTYFCNFSYCFTYLVFFLLGVVGLMIRL